MERKRRFHDEHTKTLHTSESAKHTPNHRRNHLQTELDLVSEPGHLDELVTRKDLPNWTVSSAGPGELGPVAASRKGSEDTCLSCRQ